MAADIFQAVDNSGDGSIDVRELFLALAKFPQIIRHIKKANVLFEDSEDEGGDAEGKQSAQDPNSNHENNSNNSDDAMSEGSHDATATASMRSDQEDENAHESGTTLI